VKLADDTVLQPDVLVFYRKQVTAYALPGPPLLAVEVLSPSTRRFDVHLKRHRYEAAGTSAYWVLDPGEPPALTAWELRAGEYVQVASVAGPREYAAQVPFAVTVVPDDFVDPDFPVWATR
jgi:Uma2 family endonuclease